MPREPVAYLLDILNGVRRIQVVVKGCDREEFVADELRRAAVERHLITIGEAATVLDKLAPDIAALIPSRREIVRFRNLLVHGYHRIDVDVVWGIVQGNLHELAEAVERLYQEQQ